MQHFDFLKFTHISNNHACPPSGTAAPAKPRGLCCLQYPSTWLVPVICCWGDQCGTMERPIRNTWQLPGVARSADPPELAWHQSRRHPHLPDPWAPMHLGTKTLLNAILFFGLFWDMDAPSFPIINGSTQFDICDLRFLKGGLIWLGW